MSRSRVVRPLTAALCAVVVLAVAGLAMAAPFGTAFTYQGQLRQAGVPVNGTCDLQFSLFDAVTVGSQVGVTQAATGVALVDGRFTVQLDFGGAAFDGNARWLQIATRCPAGSGGFTTLDPRQPLSPSPYALFSTSATSFSGNLAGDVTGSQGATVVARLQGRNVVNTAPADGAVLRYNAGLSQWEPVVPVDVNTIDYAFVFSTVVQIVTPPNTFQNVTLENTAQINGWTIGGGSTTLTAPAAGLYLVQYEANPDFSSGTVALRVLRNGSEITGSQTSTGPLASAPNHVSKGFLTQLLAGDTLNFQFAGDFPLAALVSAGNGTTPISASVTITRVN